MEEGVLAKWLVKEGELIKPGTMICSVETDKTTVDYESMDEGYLRKTLLSAGSSAKVNQLIAILTDAKDEDFSAYLEKAIQKNAEQMAGKGAKAPVGVATATPAMPTATASAAPTSIGNGAGPTAAVYSPASARAAVATQAIPTSGGQTSEGGRVKASPLARKIAEATGVPLSEVSGTGPQGRITRRDVESYQPAPAPAATASSATKTAKAEGPVQRPLYGSLAPILPTTDIPVNMMRKTIGRRLLESHQNLPTFYVTMKVDMTALSGLRNQLNRSPGYKISVNDIVTKASAFALRQFPQVNSSYLGEVIRQNANIDICVAVSIEGGLITPILRDADMKGLGQLSQEVKALVAKAKAGKLAPEEYQGGTFTISNLGMYGVDEFTAIINPPQCAILAVGGIQSELYLDGETPKSREVMKLTLTSDHRAIDGALAAQFLSGLKSLLENPVWLML